MLALTRARAVLRTIGTCAVRGLAAVEPRGLNRHAQHNAAAAAALARAWRQETAEAELWAWTAAHHARAARAGRAHGDDRRVLHS